MAPPLFPRKTLSMGAFGATGIDQAELMAGRLEDAGWDGAWVGEVGHDPFSILAVLAQQTSRLRLGTSIAGWMRTVPDMAGSAATLDDISRGRFRLGLGTMAPEANRDWHGIEPVRMVRRMREYIEAIRACWASAPGKPANYEGEIFQVRGLTRHRPTFSEKIPIFMAASGPQMVRLAGMIADGILVHPVHTLRTLKEVTLPQLESGAQARGRQLSDVDVSVTLWCSISNDRNEALRWAKAFVGSYLARSYTHWVFDRNGWQREKEAGLAALRSRDDEALIEAISDEIAEAVCVVGTPDEARRKVAQYAGLTTMPRFMSVGRAPTEFVQENLDRIVETFTDF